MVQPKRNLPELWFSVFLSERSRFLMSNFPIVPSSDTRDFSVYYLRKHIMTKGTQFRPSFQWVCFNHCASLCRHLVNKSKQMCKYCFFSSLFILNWLVAVLSLNDRDPYQILIPNQSSHPAITCPQQAAAGFLCLNHERQLLTAIQCTRHVRSQTDLHAKHSCPTVGQSLQFTNP